MALEAAALIVVIVALAVPSLWLIGTNFADKKTAEPKAPHPPSWPILGHLPLLMTKSNQPLHRLLYSISQIHGPIVHLQFGVRPVFVISSSDLAKECFTTYDKTFASRPQMAVAKRIGYDYKAFGFALYGTYWRELRKLCKFQLFSAQRIDSFTHVRREEVSTLVRLLFQSWQRQNNSTVHINKGLRDMVYNVMARMVASKRFSPDLSPQEFEEEQYFKNLMDEFTVLIGAFDLAHYLPFVKWVNRKKTELAMENLKRKIDVVFRKVIDDHRKKKGVHDRDLVDVLISATDNNEVKSDCNDDVVKANALIMITCAETVPAAVEWGLSAMTKHPDIMSKVQEELDMIVGRERMMEESDVPKLKYLGAVVKETLRLYPPGPIFNPRESMEDCTVGGYHIPAGALVNAWAIHRDPAVWERPTEFDPERFHNGEKEIDVKGRNFELIPFGTGRRICPAVPLAMNVVTYTLGRLLHSFQWFPPVGTSIDMMEGIGFTMYKNTPLEATIKPRLPPHLY